MSKRKKRTNKTCIFCGSRDVTIHHIVFKRFAPELDKVESNHVYMCQRCQHTYHQITDILLNYLKLNNQQIDNHEIRPPKIIPPPPTQKEVEETPATNITIEKLILNF